MIDWKTKLIGIATTIIATLHLGALYWIIKYFPTSASIIIVVSGLGIVYAFIIYRHPFEPGWTWVSVVIGEILAESGATALIAQALMLSGHWSELWWMCGLPWLAEALPGVPMIVGQVAKHHSQLIENGQLRRRHNAKR